MANWQDAGSGVKLWMPTPDADLDATQRSFTRLSVSREESEVDQNGSNEQSSTASILPSIEESLRVKQAIYRELFPSPSSRAPSVSPNEAPSSSSRETWTPQPPSEYPLFAQLEAFLTPSITKETTDFSSDLAHVYSTATLPTPNTEYSEQTDLQETPESPCPTKSRGISRRQTGLISHHFRTYKPSKKSLSVRRKLDFGTLSASRGNSSSRTSFAMGPPEYSPSHRWTNEEREVLCVLNRFYRRNPVAFKCIFNKMFGQDLKMSKVRNQFENYMRLHGENAFPVYKAVFSVPFDDPDNIFDEIKSMIEATAKDLDIDLERLEEEARSPSGRGRKAKSAKKVHSTLSQLVQIANSNRTRKIHRQLVRKASREEKAQAVQRPLTGNGSIIPPLLGGVTLGTTVEFDTSELLCNVEDCTSPEVQPLGHVVDVAPTIPSNTDATLGWRVWDASSRTKFTEEGGFTSEAFVIWRGPFPPPFTPVGEGEQAIKLLTSWHLSMSAGGASAYISVSTSLLQALTKAASMNEPRLALINLKHPSLTAPNKTLQAAEVLRSLKRSGQAKWAKYKGLSEVIVWANIKRAAVLHHFSLADLIDLAESNSAIGNMLQLHEFQAGQRTSVVSSQLREQNITLDANTAKVMGLVTKQFGLDETNVEIHHLQTFVACLVDSWTITHSSARDIHTMSSIATTFATTLHSRGHHIQDVVRAFIDGVDQGTRTLAFYSYARRRRPAARRVRTV